MFTNFETTRTEFSILYGKIIEQYELQMCEVVRWISYRQSDTQIIELIWSTSTRKMALLDV